MTDRLLTVDQAAELAQVSRRTIDRAIDRGELPASHLGDPDAKVQTRRITQADFDSWIARRAVEPRRRDSGRAEQIAPVIAISRPRRRRTRSTGRLTVDAEMGR